MIKYIRNFWFDSIFFFSPLFIVSIFSLIVHFFFPEVLNIKTDPIWLFIFIIIFDVAHVWWTLYMVYFNKLVFEKHKKLYTLTPIIVFLFAFCLTLYDRWGYILFYLIWFFAVYHFIKQQVWFIMVYAHKEEKRNSFDNFFDKLIWWTITWFPILYWWNHLDTRNYIWFMPGEFIKINIELFPFLWIVFTWIIFWYFIYELLRSFMGRKWNLLKYFYIFTTFFIWFHGIVWNNSVILFAFGNVFLHGINYIGIVYHSTLNKLKSNEYQTNSFIRKILWFWFIWFFLVLLIIAWIEEYLWDQFFRFEVEELWGNPLYRYAESLPTYAIASIVWILTIPQITHYFLDGYIWKKDFNPKI